MQCGVSCLTCRLYLQRYFTCLINQIAGSWGGQCVPVLNAVLVMYKGHVSCLPEDYSLRACVITHIPTFVLTSGTLTNILHWTLTPCSFVLGTEHCEGNALCVHTVPPWEQGNIWDQNKSIISSKNLWAYCPCFWTYCFVNEDLQIRSSSYIRCS